MLEDKIENKLDIFDIDDSDNKVKKSPAFNGVQAKINPYQKTYPKVKMAGLKVGGIW